MPAVAGASDFRGGTTVPLGPSADAPIQRSADFVFFDASGRTEEKSKRKPAAKNAPQTDEVREAKALTTVKDEKPSKRSSQAASEKQTNGKSKQSGKRKKKDQ